MAVTRSQSGARKKPKSVSLQQQAGDSSSWLSLDFMARLILDPAFSWVAAIILILVEVVLNVIIIENVKYTEIDWVAYMQEVEGVIGKNGTYDYSLLKGQTGPLVYPAGMLPFIHCSYLPTLISSTYFRICLAIFIAVLLYGSWDKCSPGSIHLSGLLCVHAGSGLPTHDQGREITALCPSLHELSFI